MPFEMDQYSYDDGNYILKIRDFRSGFSWQILKKESPGYYVPVDTEYDYNFKNECITAGQERILEFLVEEG